MTLVSRYLLVAGAWGFGLVGACSGDVSTNAGGTAPVGTPCIPQEEFNPTFAGFDVNSVGVETGAKGCGPGVCLIANFRGRVTCPYGQPAAKEPDPTTGVPVVDPALPIDDHCFVPGGSMNASQAVRVPVAPQLVNRAPDVAVICSCRCAGADPKATYCACPAGYVCQDLIDTGGEPFQGSYCIKEGTAVTDLGAVGRGPSCDASNVQPRPAGCGDKHPNG